MSLAISLSTPKVSRKQIFEGTGSEVKSVPKNKTSLITVDSILLIFQTGDYNNLLHIQPTLRQPLPQDVGLGLSIKIKPKDTIVRLALASADDCTNALAIPITLSTHFFSISPVHSFENTLQKSFLQPGKL